MMTTTTVITNEKLLWTCIRKKDPFDDFSFRQESQYFWKHMEFFFRFGNAIIIKKQWTGSKKGIGRDKLGQSFVLAENSTVKVGDHVWLSLFLLHSICVRVIDR